jgi:hypothetical protein
VSSTDVLVLVLFVFEIVDALPTLDKSAYSCFCRLIRLILKETVPRCRTQGHPFDFF